MRMSVKAEELFRSSTNLERLLEQEGKRSLQRGEISGWLVMGGSFLIFLLTALCGVSLLALSLAEREAVLAEQAEQEGRKRLFVALNQGGEMIT